MKKLILALSTIGFFTLSFAAETTLTVNAKNCDAGTPCYIVKTSGTALSQAINQNLTQKQSSAMIQASIIPQIDFTSMTKLAMGANWKQATAEQQTQITNLFKQMLVSQYSTALSKFKGANVIITNSTISADNPNKAQVSTTITMPSPDNKAQPINVEYDLTNKNTPGNAWKIYDVKIENASIVTTYRSQFNDIIQKSDIDGLISQLQTKVDNLKK